MSLPTGGLVSITGAKKFVNHPSLKVRLRRKNFLKERSPQLNQVKWFNAGRLSRVPKLEMLEENNVRESFLEHGSFVSLLSNLPEAVRDLVEFEYLSGWRQGAAKKLEWKDIDSTGMGCVFAYRQ